MIGTSPIDDSTSGSYGPEYSNSTRFNPGLPNSIDISSSSSLFSSSNLILFLWVSSGRRLESSTWVFQILDSCFEGKKYESSRRSSCCERDDLGGFLVGSNSWVDEICDDADDDEGKVLHGFKVCLKVCNNDDIANRSRCEREREREKVV